MRIAVDVMGGDHAPSAILTGCLDAVGLLAHQLKDYQTAEQNMKRLLDMGWRDPNAVRFQLGQIAEEQKQ